MVPPAPNGVERHNENVVPYSSISYHQNEDRTFYIEITLLLRNQSQEGITCCVFNPLTGEEKQTSLIIASKYSVIMINCQCGSTKNKSMN